MAAFRASLSSLILAILSGRSCGDFGVALHISWSVLGAFYPVNNRGKQCNNTLLARSPCSCFGGAARRYSALNAARAAGLDVVALDMGAYFFGAGLLFPTYRGNVSGELFAATGYHAYGLTYRDFISGVSQAEPTGGELLSRYIDQIRSRDASLPPAVCTNLNLTGDPFLDATHVKPYTLFPLSGGRRLAVLALTDKTDMSLHYEARLLPYDRALESTLALLRRLPSNPPVAVICLINKVPITESDLLDHGGDPSSASEFKILKLIVETVGLDVVVFDGYCAGGVRQLVRNWAGDDVLLVCLRRAWFANGASIVNVSAQFSEKGFLVAERTSAEVRHLTCEAQGGYPDHASTATRLSELNDLADIVLGTTQGYLAGLGAEGRETFAGNCTLLRSASLCGCRVSECSAGNMIADALRWFTGADVGIINSGAIRASLLAGRVTLSDLHQLLPFTNDVLRLDRVPGYVLRDVLKGAIMGLGYRDAHLNPQGTFMQVSSTLRFEWYFTDEVPTLGNVEIERVTGFVGSTPIHEFENLVDDGLYTVGTIAYIPKSVESLKPFERDSLRSGKTDREVVSAYLKLHASTPPGLSIGSGDRIHNSKSIEYIQLGILCSFYQETCDSARHAVDLINNKTDGFFDLSPDGDILLDHVIINLSVEEVGCSRGLGMEGYLRLRKSLPQLTAVIGPECSNDATDLTSNETRADINSSTVFFSLASSSKLANEDRYPYLVRSYTPEKYKLGGFVALITFLGWSRVGLLHDDSVWGSSVGDEFSERFARDVAGALILNGDDTNFPLSEFGKTVTAELLLNRVNSVGARVVFLATQLYVQRVIFGVSYTSKKMYGKGYAWLSAWTSEELLSMDEAQPRTDMILGAAGLLGFEPFVDVSSKMHHDYLKLWQHVSSKAACAGIKTSARPYCDTDGDGMTVSDRSMASWVDAVLIYAMALHMIFRSAPNDPAALYGAVLNLAPFDSFGGENLTLDSSADRRGSFDLVNLQIIDTGLGVAGDGTARRLVEFTSSRADFQVVGRYDATEGLSMFAVVQYPGRTTERPLDRVLQPDDSIESAMQARDIIILSLLVTLGSFLVAVPFVIILIHHRRRAPDPLRHAERDTVDKSVIDMLYYIQSNRRQSCGTPRVGKVGRSSISDRFSPLWCPAMPFQLQSSAVVPECTEEAFDRNEWIEQLREELKPPPASLQEQSQLHDAGVMSFVPPARHPCIKKYRAALIVLERKLKYRTREWFNHSRRSCFRCSKLRSRHWTLEERCQVLDLAAIVHTFLRLYRQEVLNDNTLARIMQKEETMTRTRWRDVYDSVFKVTCEDDPRLAEVNSMLEEMAAGSTASRPMQLTADLIQLMEEAALSQHMLVGFTRELVESFKKTVGLRRQRSQNFGSREHVDVHTSGGQLKSVFRIVEKAYNTQVASSFEGLHFADCLDCARDGIIFDNVGGVLECLKLMMHHLRAGKIEILRVKNRLEPECATEGGWRDILINLRFPPHGHVCELQLILGKLYTARKDLGGHDGYDRYRSASELLEILHTSPQAKNLSLMSESQVGRGSCGESSPDLSPV